MKGVRLDDLIIRVTGEHYELVNLADGRVLIGLPYMQVVRDGRPPVMQLIDALGARICQRCGGTALEPPVCQSCRRDVERTLGRLRA